MGRPREAWKHETRSRHERGYGYAWTKLRRQILKRDGYRCRCNDCTRDGLLRHATEVDHRISKAEWLRTRGSLDGVDDPSNLQAINAECHQRKTAREKGATVRGGCGADGMPTDPQHPWNASR